MKQAVPGGAMRGSATEIAALIETLHRTGQTLEDLTCGEVDAVADESGRNFLLQRAQEHLRERVAERQAAILDALPANLALLDFRGVIVSVNAAWREFGTANGLHHPGSGVGVDYLATCDAAAGEDAAVAKQVALGIRAVLGGVAQSFSLEYPCHSPGEERWFLMKATPLSRFDAIGAIVMHVDISAQHRSRRDLERTQAHLVQVSRQAGMAEVATNILHNVGNVLNSVNVSISLASARIAGSRAAGLASVVALMRSHSASLGDYLAADPEGRHVLQMLGELSDDWLSQQDALGAELAALRANVDHIKRIVCAQQEHAKTSDVAEPVDLRELLESSVRMIADYPVDPNVRIVCEFGEVAPILVERHKVLQILVNLVRNAHHACVGVTGSCGITLRLWESDGCVRIAVSDTGSGVAPENLVRIFAHGFTTRKDGHGFGLHSGALDAAELGGSLTAHSDGIGRGATFTLELPATREPARA